MLKAFCFLTIPLLTAICAFAARDAQELNVSDVSGLLDKAKETAHGMVKPENIHREEGEREAQKVIDTMMSDEYQRKVAEFTRKLKEEMLPVKVQEYYKDAINGKPGFKLSDPGRLYIFVSSSVPLETIREYVRDAVTLGAGNVSFALRGGVEGLSTLGPTAKFIASCILEDKDCDLRSGKCKAYGVDFMIDPLAYKRYGIDAVPAIVYAPSAAALAYEDMSGGEAINAGVGEFYAIYGDVSLKFALEQIGKVTGNAGISVMLRALDKN